MSQTTENINQYKHTSRVASAKVKKHLPQDLLPQVTVVLQDSGYVTISSRSLTRPDWHRIDEKVRQMGGIWVSSEGNKYCRIPNSQTGNNNSSKRLRVRLNRTKNNPRISNEENTLN